jgi:hypothetical protein
MQISLFPASFTKIISPFLTHQVQNFLQQNVQFLSYTLLHIIITQFCVWYLLGLLFRAVNSNQLVLRCSLLNISFHPFLALWYSHSVFSVVPVVPVFSMLSSTTFSRSRFREGSYYFTRYFYKSCWCFFGIDVLGTWRCIGWFCYQTLRSVSDIGINLHQKYFHSMDRFCHMKPLFNVLFGKCLTERISNNACNTVNDYNSS